MIAHRATPGEAALFDRNTDVVAFLRTAVDISTVDVEAASRNGVLVAHADKSFVPSTAEIALALMLDLARNVSESTIDYRRGGQPPQRAGFQLRGKVAGLIGCGAIGTYLCDVLAALGVEVLVADPYTTGQRRRHPPGGAARTAGRLRFRAAAGGVDSRDREPDRRRRTRPNEAGRDARQRVAGRATRRARRGCGARHWPAGRPGDGRRASPRPAPVARTRRPARCGGHTTPRRSDTRERRRPGDEQRRAGAARSWPTNCHRGRSTPTTPVGCERGGRR